MYNLSYLQILTKPCSPDWWTFNQSNALGRRTSMTSPSTSGRSSEVFCFDLHSYEKVRSLFDKVLRKFYDTTLSEMTRIQNKKINSRIWNELDTLLWSPKPGLFVLCKTEEVPSCTIWSSRNYSTPSSARWMGNSYMYKEVSSSNTSFARPDSNHTYTLHPSLCSETISNHTIPKQSSTCDFALLDEFLNKQVGSRITPSLVAVGLAAGAIFLSYKLCTRKQNHPQVEKADQVSSSS